MGYNRVFIVVKDIKIVMFFIGYVDGIIRIYGNGVGWVIINRKKVFIVGNVCMDMVMVDIIGIDCKEGDEVFFFGENFFVDFIVNVVSIIFYELIMVIF